MSYTQAQFASEIARLGKTFYAYPNVKAELTLMSTAVKADTTTHSREMETPLGMCRPPTPILPRRRSTGSSTRARPGI